MASSIGARISPRERGWRDDVSDRGLGSAAARLGCGRETLHPEEGQARHGRKDERGGSVDEIAGRAPARARHRRRRRVPEQPHYRHLLTPRPGGNHLRRRNEQGRRSAAQTRARARRSARGDSRAPAPCEAGVRIDAVRRSLGRREDGGRALIPATTREEGKTMRVHVRSTLAALVVAGVAMADPVVTITPPSGARFFPGQRFDIRVEAKGKGKFSATMSIDGKCQGFSSPKNVCPKWTEPSATADGVTLPTPTLYGGFHLPGVLPQKPGSHTITPKGSDDDGTTTAAATFVLPGPPPPHSRQDR